MSSTWDEALGLGEVATPHHWADPKRAIAGRRCPWCAHLKAPALRDPRGWLRRKLGRARVVHCAAPIGPDLTGHGDAPCSCRHPFHRRPAN